MNTQINKQNDVDLDNNKCPNCLESKTFNGNLICSNCGYELTKADFWDGDESDNFLQ